MIWTCVAKRRQCSGEEIYEVEGARPRGRPKKTCGERLWKKTVTCVN